MTTHRVIALLLLLVAALVAGNVYQYGASVQSRQDHRETIAKEQRKQRDIEQQLAESERERARSTAEVEATRAALADAASATARARRESAAAESSLRSLSESADSLTLLYLDADAQALADTLAAALRRLD